MRIVGFISAAAVLSVGLMSLILARQLTIGVELIGGTRLFYRMEGVPRSVSLERAEREMADMLRGRQGTFHRVSTERRGDLLRFDVAGDDPSQVAAVRAAAERENLLELRVIDGGALPSELPTLPAGVEVSAESVAGAPGHPPRVVQYFVARGPGSRERLARFARSLSLRDRELRIGRDRASPDTEAWRTYVVEADVPITGSMVREAIVVADPTGYPAVSVTLDRSGTSAFAALTERHLYQRVAIIVDGEVASAPVVTSRVRDGRVLIDLPREETLEASYGAVAELADQLRAGSLPYRLRFEREERVEPVMSLEAVGWVALSVFGIVMLVVPVVGFVRYRRAAVVLALPAIMAVVVPGVMTATRSAATPGAGVAWLVAIAVALVVAVVQAQRSAGSRGASGSLGGALLLAGAPFAVLIPIGAALALLADPPLAETGSVLGLAGLAGVLLGAGWVFAIETIIPRPPA